MVVLNIICAIITALGGFEYLSVGLFEHSIIAGACGGADTIAARIIYTVIAISTIWLLGSLLIDGKYDFGIEE